MAIHIFVLSFILLSALTPLVHLLVPPKTPVLSGFEPAAVGSYRELVCDASQPDAGTITYKWYKYATDGVGVESWESNGPIGTSQKYVLNLVRIDSGKYKCRASNSAGTRDSEWGDLYVYRPCSSYTVSVSPAKPAIGSTFTLYCHIPNPSGFSVNWLGRSDTSSAYFVIATANAKGCHAPIYSRYSWSSCSPPSFSSSPRIFNLQVTNAQTSDSGYWVCEDINLSCQSNPTKVVVQAPPGTPQISGFPSGPITAGTLINLKCVASPTGDTYDWYKNGTKVTTSLSYDFQVTKESAGFYKCEARNDVGAATSSDKTLVVYFNPSKITMLQKPPTTIHEGQRITIICETDSANPVADVLFHRKRTGGTWEKLTSGITSESRSAEYNGMIRKSTLTVTENRLDSQAVFKCEVREDSFQVEQITTLNVYYPPTAKLSSAPSTVKEGDTVTLTCEASGGNPTVYTYVWYYNSKQIPNVNSKVYRIPSIQYNKSGEYRCRVVNYSPDGIADASLKIDVLYKAKWNPKQPMTFTVASKPNAPVKLTLHIIANPRPINVTWFHPNHKIATDENFIPAEVIETYTLSKGSVGSPDYGNYTVKVTNFVGISSFVFELLRTAPSVPTFTITRNGKVVTVAFGPLRGYTRFQLRFCGPGLMLTTTGCSGSFFFIRDPAKTNYTIHVTHETTIYVFYLDLYDGDDVVYSSGPVQSQHAERTTAMPAGSGSNGGMIAISVVLAIVIIILVAVIVVVVVVLHRRNMACFSGGKIPKGSNLDDEKTSTTRPESVFHDPIYMNVNRAFEGETGGEQTSDEGLQPCQQEKRVQEVVYDDIKLAERPSCKNAAHKVEGGDENPYDEMENP